MKLKTIVIILATFVVSQIYCLVIGGLTMGIQGHDFFSVIWISLWVGLFFLGIFGMLFWINNTKADLYSDGP